MSIISQAIKSKFNPHKMLKTNAFVHNQCISYTAIVSKLISQDIDSDFLPKWMFIRKFVEPNKYLNRFIQQQNYASMKVLKKVC